MTLTEGELSSWDICLGSTNHSDQMKGIQKTKGQDLQKPFPGCMGRVVNVFGSNANIVGTKLLTERAHRDGTSVGRNRSNAVKVPMDPVTVQREEKEISSELRKSSSNKRSTGTPIKRLIEEEMWKEGDQKHNPPNVVARLMGVDRFPVGQSDFTSRRISKEEHSFDDLSGDYHSKLYKHHLSSHGNEECKDVYPLRIDSSKCENHGKERREQNCYEKRMSIVHEKFVEAKRLATREKLLHSKEFRQALQVLSSNRDLFLKFLEEPNSFLSKRLHENVSPPSDMKRITVLKPSKTVEIKGKRLIDKQLYSDGEESDGDSNKHYRSSSFSSTKARDLSEPTRIVVLKPNPRKPQEIKSMATSLVSSPTSVRGRESKGVSEADEAIGSRILAKEITRQMRESLKHKLRDETSVPSTYTNNYIGEETSLHQSKGENMEERKGSDLSEWEFASPTSSRHSWDYTNRIGSPCSISSFRTARSFESSVALEAKKRLSERWAMVASKSCSQEQEDAGRSSSTLGEMLSTPEVKKEQVANEAVGEQGEKEYTSKSVSVSSKANEDIELNTGASHSLISSAVVPKEVSNKSKSKKSLFSGKVSSLFFSRSKKSTREEYNPSTSSVYNGRVQHCEVNDGLSQCTTDGQSKQRSLFNSETNFGKTYSVHCDTTDKGTTKEGIFGEPQDQPSPVSVLEVPFTDDYINNIQQPSESTIVGPPQALSRSPPIESIARLLSRDNSQLEVTSPNSLRLSRVFSKADEEQNRFMFIQKLVFSAGLERENLVGNYIRWHSLESPLSPLLLDELSEDKEEGVKSRERQSKEKLVFDSVNEVLIETARTNLLAAYPWARTHGFAYKERPANLSSSVADEVWGVVRNWSYYEKYFLMENNNSCLVVGLMVNREAAGGTWTEMNWFEMYDLNNELCEIVLEELVEAALLDLTSL